MPSSNSIQASYNEPTCGKFTCFAIGANNQSTIKGGLPRDIIAWHSCRWGGECGFSFGCYPCTSGWIRKKVPTEYTQLHTTFDHAEEFTWRPYGRSRTHVVQPPFNSILMPTGLEPSEIIVTGADLSLLEAYVCATPRPFPFLSLVGSFGVTSYHPDRVMWQFGYDQALPRTLLAYRSEIDGNAYISVMTPAMIDYWGRFISEFGTFMSSAAKPIRRAISSNSRLSSGDFHKIFVKRHHHTAIMSLPKMVGCYIVNLRLIPYS
ncbi:hypothetical protein CCACVL1_19220 [Corchorus capsularis]|uniref:Uncharacterized protein n=1 Tax=Corchorus capsularis TaxID=210143 RepID=A0A1R3HHL9_COCAP|nr:hypothetical protein CCACVL1_19220 [Corchorus capsularis]